eukprot:318608-Pleurochrysis_carterae.AAC.1
MHVGARACIRPKGVGSEAWIRVKRVMSAHQRKEGGLHAVCDEARAESAAEEAGEAILLDHLCAHAAGGAATVQPQVVRAACA